VRVDAPHLDRMHIAEARRVCDACGAIEGETGPIVSHVLKQASASARDLGVNVSLCVVCVLAHWHHITAASLNIAKRQGVHRARRKALVVGGARGLARPRTRIGRVKW
jgi:hypothetical protein